MSKQVSHLQIWIHVQDEKLTIDYTPASKDAAGHTQKLEPYRAQFVTPFAELPANLPTKLDRLSEYAFGALDIPDLNVGDTTGRGKVDFYYVQFNPEWRDKVLDVAYRMEGHVTSQRVPISEATMRLIDNIWPMCEQMAWDHLRAKIGAPALSTAPKRKVFLSYRKKDSEREDFVKAIAHRLGREGFLPWLDRWEIVAGDSLPGRLAEGLASAYAIICVLTPDYSSGRWAPQELENAITQRVEKNIKIIPVIYEACDRPELVRQLAYVNCTVHENFERQFLDIIDALNELELNPYRR